MSIPQEWQIPTTLDTVFIAVKDVITTTEFVNVDWWSSPLVVQQLSVVMLASDSDARDSIRLKTRFIQWSPPGVPVFPKSSRPALPRKGLATEVRRSVHMFRAWV